jgi:hypothetical protein
VREVTAGDLIRRALSEGSTELGLAKRIAGSDDDKNADVQRWRFVVHRAAEGAEPNDLNAKRIAEVFEQTVERPHRRLRAVPDNQAALEAEVLRLSREVDRLAEQVERLTGRVELLERRSPPESPEAGTADP